MQTHLIVWFGLVWDKYKDIYIRLIVDVGQGFDDIRQNAHGTGGERVLQMI